MKINIKNKNLITKNSKFSVYYYHVIESNGQELDNYLVVVPNINVMNSNGKNITGVVIVPMVDKSIGLIQIYRPALEAYLFEFPHGLIDERETIDVSARRELLEETGLSVNNDDLLSMGYITPDPGIVAARIHCFMALNCKYSQPIQHELGLSGGIIFKSFAEVDEMILNSEIEDAITISAWHKFKLTFKNI